MSASRSASLLSVVEQGESCTSPDNTDSEPLSPGIITRQRTTKETSNATKILGLTCLVLVGIIIALLANKLEPQGIAPLVPNDNTGVPSVQEVNWEREYQSLLTSDSAYASIKTHLQFLSNYTHVAGSQYDYQTALYVRQAMLDAGIPIVELEQHSVLLSFPTQRALTLTYPSFFSASLTEEQYSVDPTGSKANVPTFHGFSANASLTGVGLVYASYCLRDHFDFLVAEKVNLTGRVCLCRYGEGWRGDKASLSQEYGCSAVLIYSDPQDDGYTQGSTYPDGPWKPATGVQRGSIYNGNGDPLTPNWPSSANGEDGYRITPTQARDASLADNNDVPLPTIPSMPISWADALPLLSIMTGPNAPKDWQGGLNITYRLGGNDDTLVDFHLTMMEEVKPIWDVIGTIPGSVDPSATVLMGAHRDAWTFGAVDPLSGQITLLATAEALGSLYKNKQWRPARTIKLCSWDGEEWGLFGSVEFVETHESSLMLGGIAYMNMDTAVTGFDQLAIIGHPMLSYIVSDAAKSIPSPRDSKQTMYDDLLRSEPYFDPNFNYPLLGNVSGTGSDYGGFEQRVGVMALDFEYNGGDNDQYGGAYHTSYDSFYWQTHFGDGQHNYHFHGALASLIGTIGMRLADSELLPITVSPYASVLESMWAPLYNSSAMAFPQLARQLHSLDSAINNFTASAKTLDNKLASIKSAMGVDASPAPPAHVLIYINHLLAQIERYFLYMPGLSGRGWYRNTVWCTSISDDYSGSGLALIGDAISANDEDGLARSLWLIQHSIVSANRAMNDANQWL